MKYMNVFLIAKLLSFLCVSVYVYVCLKDMCMCIGMLVYEWVYV